MTRRRLWIALVAFAGHVPGLLIMTRVRLTSRLKRVNAVAIGLTLAAMAGAFAAAPTGERGWWLLYAWLVGHFLWSTIFSAWILAGGAALTDD